MATAGQMIIAGDVARVLWWYEHAGRGSKGWEYARAKLAELHPDSRANSIAAVMRIARETVQVGNNYRRGRPGYVPGLPTIPDARPLEYGIDRPPPPPGGEPPGTFIHEGIVQIFDAGRDEEAAQQFNITIRGGGPLPRDELERLLREQAQALLDKFLDYDRDRLGQYEWTIRIRIGGVYRSL